MPVVLVVQLSLVCPPVQSRHSVHPLDLSSTMSLSVRARFLKVVQLLNLVLLNVVPAAQTVMWPGHMPGICPPAWLRLSELCSVVESGIGFPLAVLCGFLSQGSSCTARLCVLVPHKRNT